MLNDMCMILNVIKGFPLTFSILRPGVVKFYADMYYCIIASSMKSAIAKIPPVHVMTSQK